MARGGRHQAERADSDNRFRHRFGQSDMLQTYVMFFVMLSMCRLPSGFIRPKSRYKFQIFFTGMSDCQAHACLVLDRIQGTSLRDLVSRCKLNIWFKVQLHTWEPCVDAGLRRGLAARHSSTFAEVSGGPVAAQTPGSDTMFRQQVGRVFSDIISVSQTYKCSRVLLATVIVCPSKK
jgi:hypothetical protein